MDLKAQIKAMLVEELNLDVQPGDIPDDGPLFAEGLGLDSLDALQLAVALEERFGVRVHDEDEGREAFASVDAMATFIAREQGRAGA